MSPAGTKCECRLVPVRAAFAGAADAPSEQRSLQPLTRSSHFPVWNSTERCENQVVPALELLHSYRALSLAWELAAIGFAGAIFSISRAMIV